MTKAKKAEDVQLDRRAKELGRRKQERHVAEQPVAAERRQFERREKVSRRRQIDPTTCEREYSVEEIEFMNALDQYKRTSGRMFPTCSEMLEVLRGLGYVKTLAAAPTWVAEEPAATALELATDQRFSDDWIE